MNFKKLNKDEIGQELHDDWINGSNYDVDHLIKLTDSE